MSSPPPGYNPEASQLHGGTDAPIAKVMGGGGSAPEGYNETQSLLHGGTDVPIVKMTGGASTDIKDLSGAKPSVKFANTLGPGNVQGKTKTENGKSTGKDALEHTALSIQAEVYTPMFSEEDSTEIREFVTSFSMKNAEIKKKLTQLIELFKSRSKSKLVRYDKNSKSQSATIPSVTAPQTLAHKIVEILPSTTSNIVVIPPVKGNYEMFIRTVEFLYTTNLIDQNDIVQNAVIIFMSPFFNDETNQQKLLYSFLHLKDKNNDSVFVLNNDDEHARTIGNAFYTDILPGDGLYLNYLNPSYVILPKKVGPYEGLIFSSSTSVNMTIPKISRGFLPLSKLLDKKAFSFNTSGTNSDESFLKYLTFLSQNDNTQIPKTIVGTEACGTLKTVFDLKEPGPFQISSGEDIYIFRFETNRRPLLCTALIDETDKFKGGEQDPGFHEAPTIDVYVDGQKWKFRDPGQNKFTARLDEIASGEAATETRNPVLENWERSIYSTSEAGFLNHLNLSPLLLGIIFKSDIWKAKVAGFLNNMVTSNCFEDTAILSKGVCEETRVFLNTVFNYLFVDTAVKQEEMNVPPFKVSLPHGHDMGEIKWPPELEEITSDEFEKENFGSLDVTTNIRTNMYFTDLIVVHKKTAERSMRRLRIDRAKAEKEKEEKNIDVDVIVAEILEDLKDDHPDFLFIY